MLQAEIFCRCSDRKFQGGLGQDSIKVNKLENCFHLFQESQQSKVTSFQQSILFSTTFFTKVLVLFAVFHQIPRKKAIKFFLYKTTIIKDGCNLVFISVLKNYIYCCIFKQNLLLYIADKFE